MPIYTFTCPTGHEHDKIVKLGTESAKCPSCGRRAKRQKQEVPGKRNPKHGIQTEMR
jgi:putative FmdB family regulatory protein